jgi:hypothetical protein
VDGRGDSGSDERLRLLLIDANGIDCGERAAAGSRGESEKEECSRCLLMAEFHAHSSLRLS